jgi:hypothetical protein
LVSIPINSYPIFPSRILFVTDYLVLYMINVSSLGTVASAMEMTQYSQLLSIVFFCLPFSLVILMQSLITVWRKMNNLHGLCRRALIPSLLLINTFLSGMFHQRVSQQGSRLSLSFPQVDTGTCWLLWFI